MSSFLKEQLKRIQDLAAQLSSLEKQSAQLTHERESARVELPHGPLADVKDLRTYSSVRERRHSRSTADDAPRPGRRRRRS